MGVAKRWGAEAEVGVARHTKRRITDGVAQVDFRAVMKEERSKIDLYEKQTMTALGGRQRGR